LLDVTGCTCPTGLLWRGIYDPTGVQYKVPEWVIVEPEGVAEAEEEEEEEEGGGGGKATSASVIVEEEEGDGVETPGSGGDEVKVRIRTSHDQKDVSLKIRKRDSVGGIVEKLKQQVKVTLFFLSFSVPFPPLLFTQELTTYMYSLILPLESDSSIAAAYTMTMRRWMRFPAGTLTMTLCLRRSWLWFKTNTLFFSPSSSSPWPDDWRIAFFFVWQRCIFQCL